MVGSGQHCEYLPMPPRIRQIQIQNYKSIERAVVDLAPFTVLVGLNGAGKSNFLDALVFVQECLARSIETAWERHGGHTIPTYQREAPAVGFRLLLDLSEEMTADYSFEIRVEDLDFTLIRERCVLRTNQGRSTGFEVANGRFVQEIPGIRPKLAADRLALFAASALDEFRPVYDFLTSMRLYSIVPGRLRGWQKLDSGEVLKSDGSNASSVLNHLQQLSDQSNDERHERICRLLSKVVPGIREISPASDESRREAIIEFLQDIGEKSPFTFSSLEMSDGTLRILGLLLAVYQPQHPAVLLVEEPEVTIHPAAAELVTQVLLDAAHDRQVLITTHSPDILDFKDLSDSQIRIVTMEKGRTIIAPLSSASRQPIRERLYTPGELLRLDELSQDVEAARKAAQALDLFTETPSGS